MGMMPIRFFIFNEICFHLKQAMIQKWDILGVWKLNIHPVQGGGNDEKSSDVIHINLIRPLVFVQPVAVDRAILFWLSYKNAWEYWTEQRLNLNKEVLAATEQVLEKVNIEFHSFQPIIWAWFLWRWSKICHFILVLKMSVLLLSLKGPSP